MKLQHCYFCSRLFGYLGSLGFHRNFRIHFHSFTKYFTDFMIWIVLELWVTFGKTANLHQMSSEDLCVWDVFALLVLSSRAFFSVSESIDQGYS